MNPGALNAVEPAVRSKPHRSLRVFQRTPHGIIRKAFLDRKRCKRFVFVLVESIGRANPEIPFAIFKKREDAVVRQSALRCQRAQLPLRESLQASATGADPETSLTVHKQLHDRFIREPVLRGERRHLPLLDAVHPDVRADPDASVAPFSNGPDDIREHSSPRRISAFTPVFNAGDTGTRGADPQTAVSGTTETPDCSEPQVSFKGVRRELSIDELDHTAPHGADPECALLIDAEREKRIRCEAVFDTEAFEAIVSICHEPVACRNPQRPFLIFRQSIDTAVLHLRCVDGIVNRKAFAVEIV